MSRVLLSDKQRRSRGSVTDGIVYRGEKTTV